MTSEENKNSMYYMNLKHKIPHSFTDALHVAQLPVQDANLPEPERMAQLLQDKGVFRRLNICGLHGNKKPEENSNLPEQEQERS